MERINKIINQLKNSTNIELEKVSKILEENGIDATINSITIENDGKDFYERCEEQFIEGIKKAEECIINQTEENKAYSVIVLPGSYGKESGNQDYILAVREIKRITNAPLVDIKNAVKDCSSIIVIEDVTIETAKKHKEELDIYLINSIIYFKHGEDMFKEAVNFAKNTFIDATIDSITLKDTNYYSVYLQDSNGKNISAIKLIRELIQIETGEAINMVKNTPVMVKNNMSKAQAEEMMESFKENGLKASMEKQQYLIVK